MKQTPPHTTIATASSHHNGIQTHPNQTSLHSTGHQTQDQPSTPNHQHHPMSNNPSCSTSQLTRTGHTSSSSPHHIPTLVASSPGAYNPSAHVSCVPSLFGGLPLSLHEMRVIIGKKGESKKKYIQLIVWARSRDLNWMNAFTWLTMADYWRLSTCTRHLSLPCLIGFGHIINRWRTTTSTDGDAKITSEIPLPHVSPTTNAHLCSSGSKYNFRLNGYYAPHKSSGSFSSFYDIDFFMLFISAPPEQ